MNNFIITTCTVYKLTQCIEIVMHVLHFIANTPMMLQKMVSLVSTFFISFSFCIRFQFFLINNSMRQWNKSPLLILANSFLANVIIKHDSLFPSETHLLRLLKYYLLCCRDPQPSYNNVTSWTRWYFCHPRLSNQAAPPPQKKKEFGESEAEDE